MTGKNVNYGMKKITKLSLTFLLCISFSTSFSQDKKKWDVSDPGGNYKEVNFTVDEGTWMNVDVSPDGKDIVFDL